jgi:hypothetical protein
VHGSFPTRSGLDVAAAAALIRAHRATRIAVVEYHVGLYGSIEVTSDPRV